MLKYNLLKVLSSRGITNPVSYLQKNGFSQRTAYKIANDQFRRISLDLIERLCLVFRCTPNDLIEWVPGSKINLNEDIPLKKLIGSSMDYNILKIVRDVPLDKMEEFAKKMEEAKKSL